MCSKLDNLSEELKEIKEEKKNIIKELNNTNKKEQKNHERKLEELKKGTTTGGGAASYTKQKAAEFAIGKNYNKAFYQYAKYQYGPDTAGMLDLAHEKRNDTKYEQNAIKLKNWNDPRIASDKEYLVKKIGKQYRDLGNKIEEIPGYFFKNYSEPSIRIANDPDFLKTIKENKEHIKKGEDISIEFPNYGRNIKSNLHYALGHVDIRNGYLDKEGNLHIKVYDTYDFNEKNMLPLNQAGRQQMLKGNLKPFFSIHDILIPKEKIDKLWE